MKNMLSMFCCLLSLSSLASSVLDSFETNYHSIAQNDSCYQKLGKEAKIKKKVLPGIGEFITVGCYSEHLGNEGTFFYFIPEGKTSYFAIPLNFPIINFEFKPQGDKSYITMTGAELSSYTQAQFRNEMSIDAVYQVASNDGISFSLGSNKFGGVSIVIKSSYREEGLDTHDHHVFSYDYKNNKMGFVQRDYELSQAQPYNYVQRLIQIDEGGNPKLVELNGMKVGIR